MKPRYEYGDEVRLTRNVRNDGTYPGLEVGEPLVKRGSVGFVQNIGTYLQEYTIYSVHFMEQDVLVGCKEEELIPADAAWVPSKFEFREKVQATRMLAIQGEVLVNLGDVGEILKVIREESGVKYHVRFPGRTLLVPETSLTELSEDDQKPQTVRKQKKVEHG